MIKYNKILRMIVLSFCFAGALGFAQEEVAQRPIHLMIAAASDLHEVLGGFKTEFQKDYPRVIVDVVEGSPEKFFRQIKTHSSPFDLFLSSEADFPKKLFQDGLAQPPQVYAIEKNAKTQQVKNRSLVILKTTVHPKEADDFVSYIRSKEAGVWFKKSGFTVPMSKEE